MASSPAGPSVDALSKLRIQRAAPRTGNSWSKWLVRILLVAVLLVVFAGAGLAIASRNEWISSDQNWLAVPDIMQSRVEVRRANVSVETGRSADATVVATGYLESRRQARIGARAPGRIEVVNVEEGSRVEPGEVLAVLEHADLDASLAAIEASLQRAKAALAEQEIAISQSKREYERAEGLWKKSMSISETEYETKKFAYEGSLARRDSLTADAALAAARVREAEQMKENMFIRAPFKGTVISKDAEVGESILPGGMGEASGRGSAVTVADLDHLEVECDVKEDYISRVHAGQLAEVAVDAVPGYRYQGRVRKVIPMGDRARATIKVKVEIINVDARLFPEMSATVYFLPEEKSEPESAKSQERRIWCDRDAVRADESGSFVWSLDEQERVQRLAVKPGVERDDRLEITSGLTGSEQIVVGPPDLKSGQRVKVAP